MGGGGVYEKGVQLRLERQERKDQKNSLLEEDPNILCGLVYNNNKNITLPPSQRMIWFKLVRSLRI